MAYKTYDKLYLGADNRAVDVDETTYRDNKSKILLINDNIAIAFAGCNKFQMVFKHLLKYEKNISELRVEDILRLNKKHIDYVNFFGFINFQKKYYNWIHKISLLV